MNNQYYFFDYLLVLRLFRYIKVKHECLISMNYIYIKYNFFKKFVPDRKLCCELSICTKLKNLINRRKVF